MRLLYSCPPPCAELPFMLAGEKEGGMIPRQGKFDFKVLYSEL